MNTKTPQKVSLSYGIGAGVAPLTGAAKISEIEGIDPFHQRVEVLSRVGLEAGLEVATERTFGSQSGAGEVGRAHESLSAVDNESLGVDARAEDSLEKFAFDE